MKNAEKQLEAAILERNLAIDEIKAGNRFMAWKHLHHLLSRLSMQPLDPEGDAVFVTASLEFSNLSFALGQGFGDVRTFLQNTLIKTERLGDRRSRGLINLHLGRLFYFAEQRSEAMKVFEKGKAEVESLGDEDILFSASEFIGLYYFIQGVFPEAKSHFERASQRFESGDWTQVVVNPSGPMWLSYCCAFLGHFHEAIGILDYYRRLALDKSNETLATTLRAVLGIILLMIKNKKEAFFHLSGALDNAVATGNALAQYFARGGLSYYYFLVGRLKESRDSLEQTILEGNSSGLIRQYASPIFLETIFEYHLQRIKPIAQFNYPQELHRIMQEPSIHLRGTILRLRALEEVAKGENDRVVQSTLEQSEKYLTRSGDPIQLAKTWVEMARVKLRKRDEEGARTLVQKAWKGFYGYGDVFYPDDLRHLLTIKGDLPSTKESRDGLIEAFMVMVQELIPSTDLDELLNRIVIITNKLFGAERGSVFWFRKPGVKENMEMKGAYNLLEADVNGEGFRPNLALIFKACQEKIPQMIRLENSSSWPYHTKAILCIPIEIGGRVQGVLYHDNSFVRDCFDHFDNSSLLRMGQFVAKYVENIISFSRHLEQKTSTNLSQIQQSDIQEILTVNADMFTLLTQADRVAASDSTVLILGETGVGKELLAQRIHRKSPRNKNALVVMDMTTIPENLIESDLFGHEKGAFTGADRLKIGRMELANRGTLFIDEIGEAPKSVQVKLLRTLQEKTLCRVGGSKTISSDFRLVTATNRDLATEVATGRFREDLFYRLNVVPLTLPPLRKRKEDIQLLARHYLKRYAILYNNNEVELTSEDEEKLIAYDWPGNVRELKNVIERAVLLWTTDGLKLDLPQGEKALSDDIFAANPTLEEMQRKYIRRILKMTNGKIGGPGGAAEILGMKRTSLNNRIKKLGLR
jgi:transcriptional regulator with GAF, ATPase, and Fis domain